MKHITSLSNLVPPTKGRGLHWTRKKTRAVYKSVIFKKGIVLYRLDYSAIAFGVLTSLILGFVIGWFAGAFGQNLSCLAILVPSLIITTIGGFIAAYYSHDFKYYNATATAVVGLLFWIPFLDMYPVWFTSTDIILSFPFAYYGAHIESKI